MAAYFTRDRSGDEINSNSLDVARDAFTWLVTGPDPVSLNGRLFEGLPDRDIPLDEVRDRLLARHCPQTTRDAVWAHLVLRARAEGGTWTIAAVGVALPALTSVAARLSDRFAGDPADVHAEVVDGFLAALSTIDLRRPRIMLRLRWAAYRSGHHALVEALSVPTPVAPGFRSSPPNTPWGHPDLVLARAVRDGILTTVETDLIGSTRLEDVPIVEWAAEHGVGAWAAYKTRKRAEVRLAAYLQERAATADPMTDQVAITPQPTTKRRTHVSKTDPKSGVQGRGDHPRSA